jgi:hypothetical protein
MSLLLLVPLCMSTRLAVNNTLLDDGYLAWS